MPAHARVPTKGACRTGAAPPSCGSTAWGQAQESTSDTDPEQGGSPRVCNPAMLMGGLAGDHWLLLWEKGVGVVGAMGSPDSTSLTGLPCSGGPWWGSLCYGSLCYRSFIWGPCSACHFSVGPLMGISGIGNPGLGVSGVCMGLWSWSPLLSCPDVCSVSS